jgi:D-alanyl-lipoteichoic acid acyltransferase DltB (MBOAT superfamily)
MFAEYLIGFLSIYLIIFHVARQRMDVVNLHAIAGIFFVAGLAPGFMAASPMIAFCLVGLLLAAVVRRHSSPRIVAAAITIIVAGFVFLKGYAIIPAAWTPTGAFTLGLSYILFRVLSLVIEAGEEANTGGLRPLPYVAYLFSPFCFISGPIERFSDFKAALESARSAIIDDHRAQAGILRIAFGYVKVGMVSVPLQSYFDRYSQFLLPEKLADAKRMEILLPTVIERICQHSGLPAGWVPSLETAMLFAILAPLYFVFIYVNFSGYMDIVAGFGRLFGVEVAENFNTPLRARNVLDFWTRWHMTLSNWFKVYFFNPMLMVMMKRWGKANPNLLAVPAYFLTFLALGVWHGTTLSFVVCGLLLGLGVAGNKLFQVWAGILLGTQRYRALGKSFWYGQFARGMCLSYISCALVTMWAVDGDQLFHLLSRAALPVFPVLAIGIAVAFALFEVFERVADGVVRSCAVLPASLFRSLAASVLLVVAIVSKLVNGLGAHTFVYQGY